MSDGKEHIRHLMLYYFRKEKNASQTAKKICSVYGEDAVGIRTVQDWFVRFRRGNFNLSDKDRIGRPISVDIERITDLIKQNPHYRTRQIAGMLNISKTSVERHLHRLGFVNRGDGWIRPIKFNEKVNNCSAQGNVM